jgi:hypothetical protein
VLTLAPFFPLPGEDARLLFDFRSRTAPRCGSRPFRIGSQLWTSTTDEPRSVRPGSIFACATYGAALMYSRAEI